MKRALIRFPLGERGVFTVAEAGPADAASLLTHARQVARESDFLNAGPGERALTLETQAAFLRRLRFNDAGFVLRGTIGSRLVAVLSIVRPTQPRLRHRAEFGLTVRAAQWGHGIGRRMGATAIALAKARGLRKLNLRVRADNRRAIRLYQTLGFAREGLSPRALRVRGRFFAEVMMGLCLDAWGDRRLPLRGLRDGPPPCPPRALRARPCRRRRTIAGGDGEAERGGASAASGCGGEGAGPEVPEGGSERGGGGGWGPKGGANPPRVPM
jgi:RimJ/RimL family protein N-acetyltransferase